MARNVSDSGDGRSRPGGAGSSESEQDGKAKAAVGRRALLTRGGVVAAGVVGAGALGAAVAGPASAQATTAVDMNTANNAGTNVAQPTEVDADNATAPAFILTNTGVDTSNPNFNGAGPNLRLTTAAGFASGPLEPTGSTVGGDLTSTADGSLWYTHAFATSSTTSQIVPAPVHTEATANVYAGISPPIRVLDTRSIRGNILNAAGNLNSSNQLLGGHTIYINLDNQVILADNVIANMTVVDTTAAGYLTVWSGAGSRPTTSNIDWGSAKAVLANLTSCVVGSATVNGTPYNNVVAIYAASTTHVVMDVLAFTLPGFEYSLVPVAGTNSPARVERLKRAQARMLAAKKQAAKNQAAK
jgi:hypothetical protein